MTVAQKEKLPFEEALDKTGFGLYNVLYACLAGFIVISYRCVAFGTTIIVPASACDLGTTSAQQGAMVAVPIVGNILGAMIWGYLADRRGRRAVLMLSLGLAAVVNALASLSVNWGMLMALQSLATLVSSAQHAVSFTLLSESVPAAWRNMVVLLVTSIFLVAQGVMAVLGMPILPLTFSYYMPALGIYWTSWRTLMLVYSLPSCIGLIWLYFMKESPKFVLAKGDADGALEILKTIHRVNNGKNEVLEVSGVLLEPSSDAGKTLSAKEQIVPLFRAPLLRYTIVMTTLFVLFPLASSFGVWLPTIANQFMQIIETGEGSSLTLCGIIAASKDAPDDLDLVPCAINVTALVIVLVVGGLQSISNACLSVVVQYAGRRNTAMACTGVFGVCGILVNLVPNAVASAILFVGYLLGVLVIGIYTAMCVALFPTHLRATAMALVMSGGRVLNFLAIQLANYLMENNCDLGFYLFASIYTSSVLVLSFLPNDRLALKPQTKPEKSEEDVRE